MSRCPLYLSDELGYSITREVMANRVAGHNSALSIKYILSH